MQSCGKGKVEHEGQRSAAEDAPIPTDEIRSSNDAIYLREGVLGEVLEAEDVEHTRAVGGIVHGDVVVDHVHAPAIGGSRRHTATVREQRPAVTEMESLITCTLTSRRRGSRRA